MPKISEKVAFHLPMGGLACSDRGYSPLALPWRHYCHSAVPNYQYFIHLISFPFYSLDRFEYINFVKTSAFSRELLDANLGSNLVITKPGVPNSWVELPVRSIAGTEIELVT